MLVIKNFAVILRFTKTQSVITDKTTLAKNKSIYSVQFLSHVQSDKIIENMRILHCLIWSLISWSVSGTEDWVAHHEIQDIVPFIGNGSVSLQMQFMVSVRRSSHEIINQQFGNGHVFNSNLSNVF